MAAESLEGLVNRPIAVLPGPVQDGKVPGLEAPPPNPVQARAVTAFFSQTDKNKDREQHSLLGFLSAGMLAHEIVSDTLAPSQIEPDEKKKKKKPGDDEDSPS